MTKAELVDHVRRRLGADATTVAAERSVDAVLDAVAEGLARDRVVKLVGFGIFRVARRPARAGYDPHRQRALRIAPVTTVSFRPGARLRRVLD